MFGRKLILLACLAVLVPSLGVPAEAVAKPRWRGDSMVKGNLTGWVGAGVYLEYNESFDNPDGEISTMSPGTFAFQYRIRNTGKRRSSFELFGARWSTPPAECTYVVKRRGVDITETMIGTGYTEKNLKAGDKTTFKVKVGAEKAGDNCSLQFMSYPTGHYDKHDEVVITVADIDATR